MARTVVHPPETGGDGQVARGPDGFASKLAKYVPVEMVSIATMLFAVFSIRGPWVWFWVGVGAVMNAVYLWTVSRQSDSPDPRLYFYVLSFVAFVLWSMATIDTVALQAGLNGSAEAGQRAFVLVLAALMVPAIDSALSTPVVSSALPRLSRA